MWHVLYISLLFLTTNAFVYNQASSFQKHSQFHYRSRYPISKTVPEMEQKLRRLNSQNNSLRDPEILDNEEKEKEEGERFFTLEDLFNRTNVPNVRTRVILNKKMFSQFQNSFNNEEEEDDNYYESKKRKSENFEVITKFPVTFADIGGYTKIKYELKQCIDILCNHTKYSRFNVRVPKGLILEGPPGNGKTLLAKGLAGEAGIGFIPVSGSEFQEKYVGVGSSRVRELFQLAKKNKPCIIFIDEIDAIGRHRSSDGESSSSERDNTLNELLVALDGFKNSSGIFVVGATNRADLLDPALIRPGRIDKRIFIGAPDAATREAILHIHTQGKPYDESIIISDLVDLTMGLSGAQIENVLNEAMLNALREDRTVMTYADIDHILNRIMAGWQPNDHQFTTDIIDHIAIHEMGHALVGLLCKHHTKMSRVIINLSSPKSPAYTVFEGSTETIFTRQSLFEHLMILLAGRIAEEVFYDITVTTGAINDFEEAFKLAEKMIIYYGMGKKVIYPNSSEKYKEMIDTEVVGLINEAYAHSSFLIQNARDLIYEGAEILKKEKILKAEDMLALIEEKYPAILNLKFKR